MSNLSKNIEINKNGVLLIWGVDNHQWRRRRKRSFP